MRFARITIKILTGLKIRLNKCSAYSSQFNDVEGRYKIGYHEDDILNKRARSSQDEQS